MAELDISANSVQLDCSVDSGICVEGVTKDLKKKIQEFKRILFILERDKEAMRLLRDRLSRTAERKIVKKKKDGQSVCNVCFTQIDTDDSKTCIACCSCAKNVCRGEKCSEWVPKDGEWRCQLCAARRDSYGKASTWVQEQYAVKRASLTEFSYPMRARSEIYIPLCDPNDSAFLCNFESVSEVPSPINPSQKQHIREYIEEVLADMIGGSLENATVEPISTNNREYQQVRNGNELQGISNVRLRRLIESVIAETIRQPPFASAGLITTTAIDSSDNGNNRETLPLNGNHCNGNGGQYFESKKYHDLLATAVLNKIVSVHGNGRHSESSPDLTSSSILDNNHNTLNLNKTEESISSSSSVEPRSESSLTDPIRSINKDDDNYGNFYDDVANDNIEVDRESVLSDFISSHMVPLPHISADPASEEDEDEEDFISVASSRDANWEDNWLFKKKKSNKTSSSVGMLVPAPKEDIRALIGDKPTDEVSDLSEVGSDTDDSSLEMVSASLEPLNDRLVNKHLIGGKNTKIVLDEIADRTSMISTSSLPDDVPPYTETKNEFVVSNDGLNESEPLKISVNNCNKAISNEAINSNVTKTIPTKAEKLAKESQVTEDESIVPPPNDFTDDEKMRNLLAKFNEEQNNKTDSGDDNSSSLSPRSSISCALSAGIDRAELDAYEGITDFCLEDEEGLASEIDPVMAETSSRRPSVIEILAAIALGPMVAVSASDDRNILTELELSSLMELNELAMAQLNAKANEERRLGVIAEESFDSGPGDYRRMETIDCNEDVDLLSSPKMVMDAIRELVGKDAIKSVTGQESSVKIEEITEESEEPSSGQLEEPDQENTEGKNTSTEIGTQNREKILPLDSVDTIKKTEEQENQKQVEVEEAFEIISSEEKIKEDMIKIEKTAQCEIEPTEEIQQEKCESKNKKENQTIAEVKILEDETPINEGLISNDEDNAITVNSLSEDLGFEKIIAEDTSSISDESLHTIGSSSEYSEDLEGDTTSFFIDEQNISVAAELSEDQKLQQSKEEILENQPVNIQTKSTKKSDKPSNEFILPPPNAFCDEQLRELNEVVGKNEKLQVTEAHINAETVPAEAQMTSDNSNNEQEITVTEEQTHNENLCTDIQSEPEVIEETNPNRMSETEEITISKEVVSQSEKSGEPPDKQSIDDLLPKAEIDSCFETTESSENQSVHSSEIEAENKKLDRSFKAEEYSQDKAEDSTGKITEKESKNIVEEQAEFSVVNVPAALKILSEAQLTLQGLSSGKPGTEELPTVNPTEVENNFIKTQTNLETLTLEDMQLKEETKMNASKSEDDVQKIEDTSNKEDIKILKEEIPEHIGKDLDNSSASKKTELKCELENQETSKEQKIEEPSIEKPLETLNTESTTIENIGALEDDSVQTELEANAIANTLSSENKSCEAPEEVKTEDFEVKNLNVDLCSDPVIIIDKIEDQDASIPDDVLFSVVREILNCPEEEILPQSEDEPVENSTNTSQTNGSHTEEVVTSNLQQTNEQNKDSSEEVSAVSVEEKSKLEVSTTESLPDQKIDTDPHEDQTKSTEDAQTKESTLAVSDDVAASEQVSKDLQAETVPSEDVTENCSKDNVIIETISTEHEVEALNNDAVVGENPVPEKINEELSKQPLEEADSEVITVANLNVNKIEESTPTVSDDVAVSEQVSEDLQKETVPSEDVTESCSNQGLEDDVMIETISTEHEVEALNNDAVGGENLVPEKICEELSKQLLEEADSEVTSFDNLNVNKIEESTPTVSDDVAVSEQVSKDLETETVPSGDVSENCSIVGLKDDVMIETISTEHEVNNDAVVGENSVVEKICEELSKKPLKAVDSEVITVDNLNVNKIQTICQSDQVSSKIDEMNSVSSELSQKIEEISQLIPNEECTTVHEGMKAVVEEFSKTIDCKIKMEDKERELIPQVVSEQSCVEFVCEMKTSIAEPPVQTESSNPIEPQTADIASVEPVFATKNINGTEDQNYDQQSSIFETTVENSESIAPTDNTVTTETNLDPDIQVVGAAVSGELQTGNTSIALASVEASNEVSCEINILQNTETQKVEDTNQVAAEASSQTIQEEEKTTEKQTLLSNEDDKISVAENTTEPALTETEAEVVKTDIKTKQTSEASEIEKILVKPLDDVTEKVEEHLESPVILADSSPIGESISEAEEKKCEENSYQIQKEDISVEDVATERLDEIPNTQEAPITSELTKEIKMECSTSQNKSTDIEQETLNQPDENNSINLTEAIASNKSEEIEEKTLDKPSSVNVSASVNDLQEQQPQNSKISESKTVENKTDDDKQVEIENSKLTEDDSPPDTQTDIKTDSDEEKIDIQIQENISVEASVADQVIEPLNEVIAMVIKPESDEKEEQTKITEEKKELSTESLINEESESVPKTCEDNKENPQQDSDVLNKEQKNELSETQVLECEETCPVFIERAEIEKSLDDDLESQSKIENETLGETIKFENVTEISAENVSEVSTLDNEVTENATESETVEKVQVVDHTIEEEIPKEDDTELADKQSEEIEGYELKKPPSSEELIVVERIEQPECQMNNLEARANTLEDLRNICAEKVGIESVIDTNDENAKEQTKSSSDAKLQSHETNPDKIEIEITKGTSEAKPVFNETNTCEVSRPSEDLITQEAGKEVEDTKSDKTEESVIAPKNETISTEEADETSTGNSEVEETVIEQSCNPTQSETEIESTNEPISAPIKPDEISEISQVEDAKKDKSSEEIEIETSNLVINETIAETQKPDPEPKEENTESVIEDLKIKSRTSEEILEPVTQVESKTTELTAETVETTEQETGENFICVKTETEEVCEPPKTEEILSEEQHETSIIESEQADKTPKTDNLKHDVGILISEEPIPTSEEKGSQIAQQIELDEVPAENNKNIEVHRENEENPSLLSETIIERVSEPNIESSISTGVENQSIKADSPVEEGIEEREEAEVPKDIADDLKSQETSPKDETILAEETVCTEKESIKEILSEERAEERNSQGRAIYSQDQTLPAELLVQSAITNSEEASKEREIKEIALEETLAETTSVIPLTVSNEASLLTEVDGVAKLDETGAQNTEEILKEDISIKKTMPVDEKTESSIHEEINTVESEEVCVVAESSKEEILENLAPKPDSKNIKDAPITKPEVQKAEIEVKLEAKDAVLDVSGLNLKADDEKINSTLNESDSTLKTGDENIEEIPAIAPLLIEDAIEDQKPEIMSSTCSNTQESLLDSETTSLPLKDEQVHIGEKETVSNENLGSSETSTTEFNNEIMISNESESQKPTDEIEDTVKNVEGSTSFTSSGDVTASTLQIPDENVITAEITQPEEDTEASKSETSTSSEVTQIISEKVQSEENEEVKAVLDVAPEIPNADVESKIVPVPTDELLEEKSVAENEEISLEQKDVVESEEIAEASQKKDLPLQVKLEENCNAAEVENSSEKVEAQPSEKLVETSKSQELTLDSKNEADPLDKLQERELCESNITPAQQIVEEISSHESSSCSKITPKEETPINQPIATEELKLQEATKVIDSSLCDEITIVRDESTKTEELINVSRAIHIEENDSSLPASSTVTYLQENNLVEKESAVKEELISQAHCLKEVPIPNEQIEENSVLETTLSDEVTDVLKSLEVISSEDTGISEKEVLTAEESKTKEVPENIENILVSDLKGTQIEGSKADSNSAEIEASNLQDSETTEKEKPVEIVLATETEDTNILPENETDQTSLRDTTLSKDIQPDTKPMEQTSGETSDTKQNLSGKIVETQEVKDQITEVKDEPVQTKIVGTNEAALVNEVNGASEEIQTHNVYNVEALPPEKLDELVIPEEPILDTKGVTKEFEELNTVSKVFSVSDDTNFRKDSLDLQSSNDNDIAESDSSSSYSYKSSSSVQEEVIAENKTTPFEKQPEPTNLKESEASEDIATKESSEVNAMLVEEVIQASGITHNEAIVAEEITLISQKLDKPKEESKPSELSTDSKDLTESIVVLHFEEISSNDEKLSNVIGNLKSEESLTPLSDDPNKVEVSVIPESVDSQNSSMNAIDEQFPAELENIEKPSSIEAIKTEDTIEPVLESKDTQVKVEEIQNQETTRVEAPPSDKSQDHILTENSECIPGTVLQTVNVAESNATDLMMEIPKSQEIISSDVIDVSVLKPVEVKQAEETVNSQEIAEEVTVEKTIEKLKSQNSVASSENTPETFKGVNLEQIESVQIETVILDSNTPTPPTECKNTSELPEEEQTNIEEKKYNIIEARKEDESDKLLLIPTEMHEEVPENIQVQSDSTEIIAEASKSLETIPGEDTLEFKSTVQSESQEKPSDESLTSQEISEIETLQEESNKVSAETTTVESTVPIQNIDGAQTASNTILATEITEPTKVGKNDEEVKFQKPSDSLEEQTPKSVSPGVAMPEDKLCEVITEQVSEVEEMPPIEILTATCKIITHPPLQPTESLIESAQYLYDNISDPILETTRDKSAPNLAEELKVAADRDGSKDSSNAERVIPQNIACESRCFTADPQPDQPIASDSVATEQPNAQDAAQDRISSESNCTDDSTTTVIDTFGSMDSQSNSDSGEEFSPDGSTDRDSSATATTANNSIVTTNKATNQSHIYSPPPQPQPELRTESACSKLLETRTTGGNEEHVDDDPLKHLVPGSIAEREYKKWYNAVDMPNNPYSVEALRRRLSGGHDRALDLPNISPCNEENPLQLCESPVTEVDNKGQERDYSRYSRDYYINDAKQASGTTKKSPTSPPQVSSPTSTASSIEVIRNGFENRNSKDWTLSTPVRRSTSLKYPKQFRSSVIPKTHNNNNDDYDDDTTSQYSSRSLRTKSSQRTSPSPSVLTHFEKQLLHKDLKRNSFRAISSTTKDFVLNPIFDQNEFFKDTKLSVPKDNLSDGDTADSGVDSCLNGVPGDGTRTNLLF